MPPRQQAPQSSPVAEEELKCSNADPFNGIMHKIPTFKDMECENCMMCGLSQLRANYEAIFLRQGLMEMARKGELTEKLSRKLEYVKDEEEKHGTPMVRQKPIMEAVYKVMNGQKLGDSYNYDTEHAKIWFAETIRLIEAAPLLPPLEENPALR